MRIGILTSSRADFGIYLPLLKEFKRDSFFQIKIIAFGTHLSHFHGYTKSQVLDSGFDVDFEVESMMLTDSKESISSSVALTILKFSTFWKEHEFDFDYVICLGDRYEMFAAVYSGLPYSIKFAHIHGGEKTLGAIDNVLRHSLTLVSSLHFSSCEQHKNRIIELVENSEHVYNVGALGLDNIFEVKILSIEEFKDKWNIDLSFPTILMTFHPETVNSDKNLKYTEELIKVIESRSNFQFLITMPNADTFGNSIRRIFINELRNYTNVTLVENLGTESYFSAMSHCVFLLGNTSSGIIEAASFNKFVINLGNRQEGRLCSENVLQVQINERDINFAIDKVLEMKVFKGENLYFKGGAAKNISKILKEVSQ